MNNRITIDQLANHPAKVQTFLTKALNRGLTVEQVGAGIESASYTVSSPSNPIDDFELWMYYRTGRNGGALELVRYAPIQTNRKGSNTTKLTRLQASILIDDMGDALARHHEREAVKARRDAHANDLNAAMAQTPEAAQLTSATARVTDVSKVKSDTPTVSPETFAHAVALVATLRANGRFAIRMARTARIPGNTPAKVRAALVNRGVVHTAGGALTDLGRTVRDLIMGAQ